MEETNERENTKQLILKLRKIESENKSKEEEIINIIKVNLDMKLGNII